MINYDDFLTFLSDRYGEAPDKIREINNFGELGLDSLSLFSLLDDIESEFDVKLDVEDLTDIDTVDKMYSYMSGRKA